MDCPFIDTNDTRCSLHLNMQHLADAFEHCTGDYMLCPIYHELQNVVRQFSQPPLWRRQVEFA